MRWQGVISPASIPVNRIEWLPCHRLVASRYPTVGPYDDVASPEDLDVVLAIAALTDPQAREERGQLSLVPVQERVTGPGATLIMSAFTHLNPLGSRFSDGGWGVYYASESLATAVAEVSHHRALFLMRTAEPPIDLDLRWIEADLAAKLHDLRGQQRRAAAAYDPDSYAASQVLGRKLRVKNSAGVVYDSVRRAEGQCVAVFKPNALSRARAKGDIGLRWDGKAISHWFHKGKPNQVSAT